MEHNFSNLLFVTTLGAVFTSEVTTPFLGVPLQVLFTAFLGSLVAMGLSDPIVPRARMFFLLIATTFIGTLLVSVMPHIPMLGWTERVPQVVIAGLCSFALQWTLLPAIELGKRIINTYKSGELK